MLHAIFSFGSSLGNELFFVLFLPWLIWEFDVEVARRSMLCWAVLYVSGCWLVARRLRLDPRVPTLTPPHPSPPRPQYVGQVAKDVCLLPRPRAARRINAAGLCAACCRARPQSNLVSLSSNSDGTWSSPDARGVICLEVHYAAEYGMPSTHAMNSLGLPWAVYFWAARSGRFTGSLVALGAWAAAYTLTSTISRLYMGVHSHADIAVGLFLGVCVLVAHLAVGAQIDEWIISGVWFAAPVISAATVALMWAYPKPRPWRSTPGDTALVVAATMGVLATAAWDAAAMHDAAAPERTFTIPSSPARMLLMLPRVAVGWAALLGTRAVVKPLSMWLFSVIVQAVSGDEWGSQADVDSGSRVGDTPAHLLGGTVDDSALTPAQAASPCLMGGAEDAGSLRRRPVGAADGGATVGDNKTRGAAPDAAAASSSESVDSGLANAPPHIKVPPPSPSQYSPDKQVRVPPAQRYAIEIPTKIAVYASLGFVALYVVPKVYDALGLVPR